MLRDGIR